MNLLRVIALLTGLLLLIQTETVLTPIEARKKVGETVTVEMTIQVTKDRLEKKGEIYMDSEIDFQSDMNFAAVITRMGAAKLREAGVEDPAEHFKGKMVRVTGLVKEVEKVPRIEVDDAKQIWIVEPK